MGNGSERERWHKVHEGHRFLDVSDYGRGAALALVRLLLPTAVTPHHLTLASGLAGLAAAYAFSRGSYTAGLLAAFLLQIKNILDAADGSLARARRKPSRIGRFLDSLTDFVVSGAVCLGLAVPLAREWGTSLPYLLAGLTFLSALLQCSYYNYYSVAYRHATQGDCTSLTDERLNPEEREQKLLAVLFGLYQAVYAWQDRLVAWVEARTAARILEHPCRYQDPGFLTRVSVLGLGTQILALDLLALAGRPQWFFPLILVGGNLYLLWLVVHRVSRVRRMAETPAAMV